MAGKYSKINLPPLQEEPAYQEKVETMKTAMASQPDFPQHAAGLAADYAVIRQRKDELKEKLSGVDLELAAITQLFIAQCEAEGTTSLKLVSGETIRIQTEPYTQVQDRETFRIWCLEHGYERQMALAWQTTNGIVKEMLLNGEAEPPGVQAFMRSTLFFSRKG